MKVGSAVLGLHIAVVCVFALTQGCITTETQGSGRGAGARHKGPWKHEHKGNVAASTAVASDYINLAEDAGSVYDPVYIESADSAPVEPSASTDIYIVQQGDILGQIAATFNTTTKALVELNNLSNPDVLYVGQELRVPPGSPAAAGAIQKPTSAVTKGASYVIQQGDTLSEIALAAGVGIDDLRSLNNIRGDEIFTGESIDIPSYGKVPSISRKSKPAPRVEPAPAALAPEPVVEPLEMATMSVDAIMDHLVYPGETLDDIARQYGVSKSEIMRLNNISDATAVQEGQRLRIPIEE